MTTHMTRLQARPRQLEVDPDCLRWTPVIVTNTVVSEGEGDDDDDEDEEEDREQEGSKDVSLKLTFSLRSFSLSPVEFIHGFKSIGCFCFVLGKAWSQKSSTVLELKSREGGR